MLSTYYNRNLESRVNYTTNEYNYAQIESEYYQEQKINKIGLGFNYKSFNVIDDLGVDLNYTDATGTIKYNQVGFKIYTRLTFYNNLNLNISYRYNNKTQSSEEYYNSIFKANISYKF